MSPSHHQGRVNMQGKAIALLVLFAFLVLPVSSPPRAAEAPPNPLVGASDPELDEVVVSGNHSTRRPGFREYQQPLDWLARMVGRFVVDGHVDLTAQGRPQDILKVEGGAECVGFGVAPGVECELKIRWPERTGPNGEKIPGGMPTLNPAVVLYGFEPVKQGIQYIMVDNEGAAEAAVGLHATPDTVQSRSQCRGFPGNCERVVRITAWPDLKLVEMRIDLEVDGDPALRYQFMLHRVPGTPSVVFGREK
jgi:hypothetical protein